MILKIDDIIDVPISGSVVIKKSIRDFRDLSSKSKRSFSYTFQVVGNEAINYTFANLFDVRTTSDNRVNSVLFDYSPTKKHKARLVEKDSEIEILRGFVKIVKIKVKRNDEGLGIIYEMVLFSDVSSLIKDMEALSMKELDMSEYTHELSHANVYNSWQGTVIKNNVPTDNSAGGFGYLYAPVFYGKLTNSYYPTDNDVFSNPCDKFNAVHTPIWFYLKELLEKAFAHYGIQLVSNFLNSSHIKKVVVSGDINVLKTPAQVNNALVQLSKNTLTYGKTTAMQFEYDGNGNWRRYFENSFNTAFSEIPDLMAVCDVDVNTGNQLDENLPYMRIFTPNNAGVYHVKISLNFKLQTDLTDIVNVPLCRYRLELNMSGNTYVKDYNVGINTINTITYERTFTMTSSDTLDILHFGFIKAYVDANFQNTDDATISDKLFELIITNVQIEIKRVDSLTVFNQNINPSIYLPDMSIADFVRSAKALFNLEFSEVDEEGKIYCEPAPSFYSAGSVELQGNHDIEIIPTATEFGYRKIHFKSKQPDDVITKAYLNSVGIGYGDLSRDTGNELASDELTVETKFTFARPSYLSSVDFTYPLYYGLSGNNFTVIKMPTLIGFFNGVRNKVITFIDKDYNTNNVVTTAYLNYPNIEHNNGQHELCFEVPRYFYYNKTNIGSRTSFFEYHHWSVLQYLSEEGRVITFNTWLSVNDLQRLDLRKYVRFDDVYWLVNSIEWRSDKELAKVELVKLINPRTPRLFANPSLDDYLEIDLGDTSLLPEFTDVSNVLPNRGLRFVNGDLYIGKDKIKTAKHYFIGKWRQKIFDPFDIIKIKGDLNVVSITKIGVGKWEILFDKNIDIYELILAKSTPGAATHYSFGGKLYIDILADDANPDLNSFTLYLLN